VPPERLVQDLHELAPVETCNCLPPWRSRDVVGAMAADECYCCSR
jgi:hypothetical protein